MGTDSEIAPVIKLDFYASDGTILYPGCDPRLRRPSHDESIDAVDTTNQPASACSTGF